MITNQTISLSQEITQRKGTIASDMGGEKVMLSVKNGKYYNLGKVGGEIWDLLDGPIEVNQMVSALMSIYEVQQEDCEEQVISFLNHLYNEGLIEIVPEAIQSQLYKE
ncbi:lasso peptide biosynthesis PqqD family chaperone [Cytobacillus firmus]|nr:lasso peptide biosynthesis PqqD family chaperone [Cytobacillus firmus]